MRNALKHCFTFAWYIELLVIFITFTPQTFRLLTEFCLLHEYGIGIMLMINNT